MLLFRPLGRTVIVPGLAPDLVRLQAVADYLVLQLHTSIAIPVRIIILITMRERRARVPLCYLFGLGLCNLPSSIASFCLPMECLSIGQGILAEWGE